LIHRGASRRTTIAIESGKIDPSDGRNEAIRRYLTNRIVTGICDVEIAFIIQGQAGG
jgi:hypothetical protein